MSSHACPRCGYESHCSHSTWHDRHPAAAVTGGLFAMMFMSLMLATYPSAAWSVIILCVGGYAWRRIDQERKRRAGLAKRADWEHRRLMAPELVRVAGDVGVAIKRHERRMEAEYQRGPRGASHFAVTEPMRSAR